MILQCDTVGSTLSHIDPISFPNITAALLILAVIPVTSCECERCNSALRRLKTWMRSTMGQERLSGLALLHVHSDIDIDIDLIINQFAASQPRRLELLDIFDDEEMRR